MDNKHTPFTIEPGDKLGSGGSGAQAERAWIWVETGHCPGDPDAPDSRIGEADPIAAAEIVRRWNAHEELVAALAAADRTIAQQAEQISKLVAAVSESVSRGKAGSGK